jgi:DNA-binding NtrC family response regulator
MALVMDDTKSPNNNNELYNMFEVKMEHIAKNMLLSKVNDKDNVLMEAQAIIEKVFIDSAMKLSKNNISKAAKLLGINRNTLSKKLKEIR